MKITGRISGSISGALIYRPFEDSFHAHSRAATYSTIGSPARRASHRDNGVLFISGARSNIIQLPEAIIPGLTSNLVWNQACSFTTTVALNSSRLGTSSIIQSYFTPNTSCTQSRNHSNSILVDEKVPSQGFLPPTKSKEELMALVDQYDDITVEEHLEILHNPYMRRYDRPPVNRLRIRDDPVSAMEPLSHDVIPATPDVQETIKKLQIFINRKLRRPHSVDLDTIYSFYSSLPGNRIPYLEGIVRHDLLRVLTMTKRSSKSMLRYFAVVADVKNSGFALLLSEWNSAMSFASRYVGVSTAEESDSVTNLWTEMERQAGIMGSGVTFNILFDVASKAGKFTLAEHLYNIMLSRGHSFDRYHHVSLIHFFGLKGLASGVRAAYRAMVDCGEMIDTVVLNAVMSGLIRCGEDDSAAKIYEKMKQSHLSPKAIPSRDFHNQKKTTKILKMFARVGRTHPELQPTLHGATPLVPDLQTYRILINHFAVTNGDLPMVSSLLDEMRLYKVPLHGTIFLALFKAFHAHGIAPEGLGASPPGDWSFQRLESVWKALLEAHDAGTNDLKFGSWLCIWALRAFEKLSGSRERTIRVFRNMSKRWDLDDTVQAFMIRFLHGIMRKRGWPMDTREKVNARRRRRGSPSSRARARSLLSGFDQEGLWL